MKVDSIDNTIKNKVGRPKKDPADRNPLNQPDRWFVFGGKMIHLPNFQKNILKVCNPSKYVRMDVPISNDLRKILAEIFWADKFDQDAYIHLNLAEQSILDKFLSECNFSDKKTLLFINTYQKSADDSPGLLRFDQLVDKSLDPEVGLTADEVLELKKLAKSLKDRQLISTRRYIRACNAILNS